MVEKIFFQSSLPRAGSTLLQNVLGQNPDFYVTPTSGVCDLLLTMRAQFTAGQEFKAQNPELMIKGFRSACKGTLYGFFNGVTDKKYVVDKCRGWSVTYNFLNAIHPNPKIIVMVRDLRSIVSSLEKKFRDTQEIDSGIQNWNNLRGTTVDKRVELFCTTIPPLSAPLDVLYDVIVRRLAHKCMFIKYENFTVNPEEEMRKIYNYLELPYYNHDYDNVEQSTVENDVFYRPFGDHMIRGKIKPVQEDFVKILGKHNCDYITNKYAWYYKAFNYPV